MLHSRRCNKCNKERNPVNWNAFKKQRNKCVKLVRQAKLNYYKNLDLKALNDNSKFWKTVKPLFSDQIKANSSITLFEYRVII